MARRASALVSTGWLMDALMAKQKIRVVDTSWYVPRWQRTAKPYFNRWHIPGAVFFDIDQCCDRTSPLDHKFPTQSTFEDYVGKLGIDNDTHVVVYDSSDFGAYSSPRVWWMFRAFGHSAVSLLDGGLHIWRMESRPVSCRYINQPAADFKASLNRSWLKTYDDLLKNLDTKEFQVVDTRFSERFRGLRAEPRYNVEPGHIPGSINVPFFHLLSPTGHFLPKDQLLAVFDQAGVDLSRPICVLCGSGVTACHAALAAHECGYPEVTLYDGGWSEWYTRAAPEYVISEGAGKSYVSPRFKKV